VVSLGVVLFRKGLFELAKYEPGLQSAPGPHPDFEFKLGDNILGAIARRHRMTSRPAIAK
jgi:hypothetical protein